MWLALALAWGSVQLFRTWMPTANHTVKDSLSFEHDPIGPDHVASEGREWRFEQLLPMILLALPLLSIWESYAGRWREILRLYETFLRIRTEY